MYKREKVLLELPERGHFSWATVEQCAAEANMPVKDWLVDAIESKMRRQDTATYFAQSELWQPTPQEIQPIPRHRKFLGEKLARLADFLWDSIDADLAEARFSADAKEV
ncbi:MAG: hypothetical protein IJY96_01285 [Oscillospiraceae bacterium]|nr:hypothetical protein [Oscillospiraceae bacterium]